jgi:DNA repair exonuclease SbcCD ATPase subunit
MTSRLDTRIEELRARRSDTLRKKEAELAEMQAQLERSVATFEKKIAVEVDRIGGVMQVTDRRVVAAEKRQSELEENLAALSQESSILLRRQRLLGFGVLVGSAIISGVVLSCATLANKF